MIKIGPAGIGGVKEAIDNLRYFKEKSIDAAEVAFTYSVYLKKDDAIKIGKYAKEIGISLSVHAPYYLNLNSLDSKKVTETKKRILDSCERANDLQATCVVFHPGYFGKEDKQITYEKIKEEIEFLQDYIKKKNWNVKLAPETTGKFNVFGSLDETLKLSKETGTSFCIDFAHLKARANGKINFKEIIEKLKCYKYVHCHYSGIEYSEKGEKNHIPVDINEFKEIIHELKKHNIDCTIICESPDSTGDAIKMKKILIGYS